MGKDKRKRDELGSLEKITRSSKVVLVGNDGTRLPVGDFTITKDDPGPTLDDFADHAFKESRASLAKLMVPQWRLVVIDGQREQGYGLDRWIKLVDGDKKQAEQLAGRGPKQTIRKKAAA
jgi:hypothetical protein